MDKELDDLLDSALDDFGKEIKVTKSAASEPKPEGEQGKVTIEKTELYVDDVDYDDRPRFTSIASTIMTSRLLGAAQATGAAKKEDELDEQMKLFDEIFNDTKTRETMKQFTEALNGFKEGDESKLIENFGRVMSQLNSENLDLDDDDDENLDPSKNPFQKSN